MRESADAELQPSGASLLFTTMLTMPADALAKALADDPARSVPMIRAAAAMGLAAGKVTLGRMLLEGEGLPEDKDAAFRWFWSAAEQGDVEAWNMVGRCFENGWGVSVDYGRAAHWFGRAAASGDAWAQYNLGHLFLNGLGVPRSAAAAVDLYRAASDQGHLRAMNLLGRCHEQGWGVPADAAAAAHCYRRSAEGGYFRGQFNHATALREAGAGDEAVHWLKQASASAPSSFLPLIVAKAIEWERPEILAD